jgi:NAD-dependent deacetylase
MNTAMNAAMNEAATVAAWWRDGHRIVVLTGAGMSAESGVPTFRDAQQGLWARYDPQQLASREGFERDPALVWRWYAWRRDAVRAAQPHAGHLALARLEATAQRLTLVTQNVDGLHARAGSRAPIELHGNILHSHCLEECGSRYPDPESLPAGAPPACPRCGSLLRPSVVWFGEALPPEALRLAQRAALECELMLVIGTSGLVYPAAGLPGLAKSQGARIVIVNPQASELDDLADLLWRETAARALPVLASAVADPASAKGA